MRLARHAEAVRVRAPAKVNLFLEILGKRPDGYHEIATCMLAVQVWDSLIFRENPQGLVQLTCQQDGLSTGADNLIVRAARLLQDQTSCRRGADIRLVKRIPMQAGLGGGSSDAAAALCGLNVLWNLGLNRAELQGLGEQLGSDVPFFFHGPAAWCTGRGELVRTTPVGGLMFLVLVCPPFGCPTGAVYANVKVPDQPSQGTEILNALARGQVEELGGGLFNRLQDAAQKVAPELTALTRRLEQAGAVGNLMSGSGSSLFALARDRQDAWRIASLLKADPTFAGCKVFVVRSCV